MARSVTAGFVLLLLSYHDAMNDTFINGFGIFLTLYLKIMTETTHAGNNVTYSALTSYILVCWRGIPLYLFTVPKFAISQSEVKSNVLISPTISSH